MGSRKIFFVLLVNIDARGGDKTQINMLKLQDDLVGMAESNTDSLVTISKRAFGFDSAAIL